MPRLGPDVPQWFGETIGFWDGDALITWTSNIQGWISHGGFEFSNKLQSIEIYTPRKDASGALVGIKQEIVLYDDGELRRAGAHRPQARQASRAQRGRSVRDHGVHAAELSRSTATRRRCRRARPFEYRVPDIYGRPWAQIWERYHEEGMERPREQTGRFGL